MSRLGPRPSPAYRWTVCLLSAACLTGLTGVVYSFGVLYGPIQETFGISADRVSLVFAVNTFLTYICGIGIGYLVDRYAPPWLLAAAIGCWAGGLVLTASAESYAGVLVFFGLFVALGVGIPYITLYAAVAQWFDRRRGLALSILSVGFGLGGLVGPPVTEALLGHFDWQSVLLVLTVPTTAVIGLTTAVLAVESRYVADSGSTNVSTSADGEPGSTHADSESESGSGRGDGGNPSSGQETDSNGMISTVLEAATSPRYLLVTLGFVFGLYAFYALLVHFVPYAESAGVSRGAAALGLGLIGGASVPSRLLAGYLSDLYDRVPVILVGFGLMVASMVGLLVGPAGWFVAFAAVFGVGTGVVAALFSPIVVDIFDLEDVGTMLGLTSISFGIAGVAGPYVTGLLVDATGGYAIALLLGTVSLFVGAGCIVLAASPRLEE